MARHYDHWLGNLCCQHLHLAKLSTQFYVIHLNLVAQPDVNRLLTTATIALTALAPAVLPFSPSLAAPAGADLYSTYLSASGSTRLRLNNETGAIDYQTQIKGQIWSGQVQPLRRLGHNGNRSIMGPFRDVLSRSFVNQPETFCAGDFSTSQTVVNNRYVLQSTWRVMGGRNCPMLGQSVNLRLVEAVPVADRQGDFFFDNSKAWSGLDPGQNDFHTWNRWQVVDASGALNCRVKPNGAIAKTYRRGDRLTASYDGRGVASAILGANNTETHPSVLDPKRIKGAPWLLTQDKCFVRANSQYIQPLSAAQDF